MKQNFLVACCLFVFSLGLKAQSNDCKLAHVGTFKIDSGEYGVTTIERTKNKQIETNDKLGFKAEYDVVWTDDCHYELKTKRVLQGDLGYEGNPTDVVKVEILKVENAMVHVRLSSNFSDFVTDAVIEKIN